MEKCADHNCNICSRKNAEKRHYLSHYQSPNIVIVPTVSFGTCQLPKKPKCETQVTSNYKPMSDQIAKSNTEVLKVAMNNKAGVENSSINSKSDGSSWASNYLQSIGQEYIKFPKLPTKTTKNVLPYKLQKACKIEDQIESNLTHPTNINFSSNFDINKDVNVQNKCDADRKKIANESSLDSPSSSIISQPEIRLYLMDKSGNTDTNKHTTKRNKTKVVDKNKLSQFQDSKYNEQIHLNTHDNNDTVKRDTNKKDTHSKYKINRYHATDNKDRSNLGRNYDSKNISPSIHKYAELSRENGIKSQTIQSHIQKYIDSKCKHSKRPQPSTRLKDKIKSPKLSEKRKESEISSGLKYKIKSNTKINKVNHSPKRNYKIKDKSENCQDSRKHSSKETKSTRSENCKYKKICKEKYENKKDKTSAMSSKNITKADVEPKRATPMKSVIQITNNFDLNKSNNNDVVYDDEDLRSKLNKKCHSSSAKKERENLIITVPNSKGDDLDIKSQTITITNQPEQDKHTIKLVINVICKKSKDPVILKEDKKSEKHNLDLSFLDDFNVDDIVECLNYCEDKLKASTSIENEKSLNKMDIDSPTLNTKIEPEMKNEKGSNFNESSHTIISTDNRPAAYEETVESKPSFLPTSECYNPCEKSEINQNIFVNEKEVINIKTEIIKIDKDSDTPVIVENYDKENQDSVKSKLVANDMKIENSVNAKIITKNNMVNKDLAKSQTVNNNTKLKDSFKSAVNNSNHAVLQHNPVTVDQVIDLSDDTNENKVTLSSPKNKVNTTNTLMTDICITDKKVIATNAIITKTESEPQNMDSHKVKENLDKIKNKNESTKDAKKVNEVTLNNNGNKSHISNDGTLTESIQIVTDTRILKKEPKASAQVLTISDQLQKIMLKNYGLKYRDISFIYGGKYSKMFKCHNYKGDTFAVKVVNKVKDYVAGIRKNYMLKHIRKDIPKDNFSCIYLINGFSMQGHWCFLTEYYPKDLKQVLEERKASLHIDIVQKLAKQLVSAVIVLRNNNVIHSDIKPAHILLNTSLTKLKLCGFDEARYADHITLRPNIGMPSYRPPEVIMGYSDGFSVDVWTTALVFYEMVTARKLFPGVYNNDILYKQMCTLGNIPVQMLNGSIYKDKHFRGNCFMRRSGYLGKNITLIHKFTRSGRLSTSILEAYNRDWGNIRNQQEKNSDSIKLSSLHNLLEEMLILHPKFRIPIEFVYANCCSN